MEIDEGWAELERLAQAAGAADAQLAFEYPSDETIGRWQSLFGYSSQEAVELIRTQRNDVTRERISDDHWSLIKAEKEAAGHDRESYEHSLQLKSVFASQSASVPHPDGGLTLLFRLGGLLSSPEKVKEVAGLDEPPVVQNGWSERGLVQFVTVDEKAKKSLEEWLTQQSVLQS
ncbi:hypothetical protein N0V91_000582 [Didymella pomorum]|uniref:Uncharacterized protein n=1 Tax=Didymella pomorum TaxID=749634 RepID=A0A9W8ZQI1_9PLEO|nr:hypothetical protein N0V91_000582 [Didymella pomorum]